MLPFLKPKKLAITIIANTKKDTPEKEEGDADDKYIKCAEAILKAVGGKDAEALAKELEKLGDY